VPVFLNGLIVIAESTARDKVDVIGIGETIVVEVVDGTCSDCGNHVEIVQLGHCIQITMFDEQIHHLGDVSAMHVIVVSNFLSVSLIDITKVVNEFVVIDQDWSVLLRQVIHDLEDYHWQSVFTSKHLTSSQAVEVEAADSLDRFTVLI